MAPPSGHRLCYCVHNGCSKEMISMDDGTVASGRYILLTEWLRHQVYSSNTFSSIPLVNKDTTLAKGNKGIERARAELRSCRLDMSQTLATFSLPTRLIFKTPPSDDISLPSIPNDSRTFIYLEDSKFMLKSRVPDNDRFVANEQVLRKLADSIKEITCHEQSELLKLKNELLQEVFYTLGLMDDHKFKEWTRQARIKRMKDTEDGEGPLLVSTDEILESYNRLRNAHIVPLLVVVLGCVLHILCHVSRDRSNFVLRMLRVIISYLMGDNTEKKRVLASIPQDIRHAEGVLELAPHLVSYINCPMCRSLYPLTSNAGNPPAIQTCTYKETPQSEECNTSLFRTRHVNGVPHLTPRVTSTYQDFPTWLARFICRPGMEERLKQYPGKLPNSQPQFIRDIWDGSLIRNFRGPDNKSFYIHDTNELRLLFGIGFDSFHPFHMKPAGKKVSVGVFFMFCYNLPQDIQYKQEYIYIIMVVNGPKQPSMTQLNHYMRPFVQHLKIFYLHGFQFPRTDISPNGLLTRGAVWPLIMDSHALRQATGLGSFLTTFFCMYCLLKFEDIDSTSPETWPRWHSCADHRALAEQWRNAPSEAARVKLFDAHNIRWSEFLELPYFQVDTMCAIDPMHAFQNVSRNLVRETWGIDLQRDSGDGIFVGKRPTVRKPITMEECLNVLEAIKNPPHQKTKNHLDNARVGVLYELCERRALRRAGERAPPLRKALKTYYDAHPGDLTKDIKLFVSYLKEGLTLQRLEVMREIRVRVARMTSESRDKDYKWLSKRNINNFRALCFEVGITFDNSEPISVLVDKVIAEHQRRPIHVSSVDDTIGAAVLGRDMIAELNKDISRTILPSWIQAGPKTFMASEHGQLSATEWRTNILVRLVITLPRIWYSHDSQNRNNLMLENFMHLVNALVIASTRVVTSSNHPDVIRGTALSTSEHFRREYREYLKGRVQLYPTAKIQPTEHITYHIGDKLEQIGPLGIASTNAFERFNGLLQDTPTNRRSGEVEKTLINTFASATNLRALVEHGGAFKEIKESFQTAFGIEGGYMLSETQGDESLKFCYPRPGDLKEEHWEHLSSEDLTLLTDYLNTTYSTDIFVPQARRNFRGHIVDNMGWLISEAQWRGIWYRKARPSQVPVKENERMVFHKDSYVLISTNTGSTPLAYTISRILAHAHKAPTSLETVTQIYIVAHRYCELSQEDASRDPWRKFTMSGGRLYYKKLEANPEIFNIKAVVSHFASTPYARGDLSGIARPCIHVLPLTWVLSLFVIGMTKSHKIMKHRMFSPVVWEDK